jgi:RNA polymerase sigma-70 factor (ECF subfamily)
MPFRTWLQRTAYERIIMARRRHLEAGRRSLNREIALPDRSSHVLAKRLVAPAAHPSEQMHRLDLVRRVRQALSELGDADREILLMRDFEELSYQEVAYILGIEPAAARQRYGRALMRLHKILATQGISESEL